MNNRNRKFLEISEYICLGLTVLGSIAAVMTQQIIYATIPLIFSIALNLFNRPRFSSSLSPQIAQLQETTDTCNQRLEKIEVWNNS